MMKDARSYITSVVLDYNITNEEDEKAFKHKVSKYNTVSSVSSCTIKV